MPGIALGALRGDLSLPEEWVPVGTVEKLYLYPVKSLAHVEVTEMTIGQFAGSNRLVTDRQFIVTDAKGKFLSSRRYPNMSLIQPTVEDKVLVLQYPGKPEIRVPIVESGPERSCDVWGDSCQGLDQGQEAGAWLSDVILGKQDGGLRLVYHPLGASSRPDKEDSQYTCPLSKAGDKPYYADGYPYLLLSTQSINKLNQSLKEHGEDLEVEATRFRPNILVGGSFLPFSEDKWSFIRIGDAVFRNVKPCSRCVFTTVDPKTGTKDKNGQPLKLLRQFRTTEDPIEKKEYGTSPFFGINLGMEVEGTVQVGQAVMVRKAELDTSLA